MKNIGLKLKEKRIQNGLSIDEVAEDLKLRPSQIESIEEGRKDDFKDIFYLKYFIRDYAKYLGLDMIKEAKKEKSEVVSNEKVSPYTKSSKKKLGVPKIIIGLIALVVLIIVGYILVSNYKGNDFSDKNITYSIRR